MLVICNICSKTATVRFSKIAVFTGPHRGPRFDLVLFLGPALAALPQRSLTSLMSVQAQADQVEGREEIRESKAMDSKPFAPKFNANLIAKAYGDNLFTGSVKSGGGDRQQQLPAALFFAHSAARVTHGQKLGLLDVVNESQLSSAYGS